MGTEKTDPVLLQHSREMRHTMTKQERHLWFDFLMALPQTVRRQKVFGSYIVDFYIASNKLVIELDGSQHYEDAGKEYDFRRDAYLKNRGLTILRYANSDVDTNFRGVCEDILQHLESKSPSPSGGRWQPPSPARRLSDEGEGNESSNAGK